MRDVLALLQIPIWVAQYENTDINYQIPSFWSVFEEGHGGVQGVGHGVMGSG